MLNVLKAKGNKDLKAEDIRKLDECGNNLEDKFNWEDPGDLMIS